jgi:transposase-like protein
MRKRYANDFIEELVSEVLLGKHTLTAIARANGVHPGVLSKWVKRQRPVSVPAQPGSEVVQLQERIQVLEERVETLRCVLEKFYSHKYS